MNDQLQSDSESLRFLADLYGKRATPLAPLSAGEWSRAYAFALNGQQMVARLGSHEEDLLKDQRMGAMSTAALPIPKMIEVGRTPSGFFAVAERHYGTLLDELDLEGMRKVLPSLLQTMHAIAELDTSSSQGYGIWQPDGNGLHATWADALLEVAGDRPRIPGWRNALERSASAATAFDAGLAVLRKLLPELPQERHYIHSDLLHHNVLVDGSRIESVLDWGNSMYGDQLYDAAWLIFCWPWYPEWRGIDIRSAFDEHWHHSGGLPANLETRLLAYQLHTGLSGMAFNAYVGHDDNVSRCAELVNALVKRACDTGIGT
ncbi:MAG: phosphotransferase family protein [Thermomicrobiales bacterium]